VANRKQQADGLVASFNALPDDGEISLMPESNRLQGLSCLAELHHRCRLFFNSGRNDGHALTDFTGTFLDLRGGLYNSGDA
jgi:hypothetical protein